MERHRHLRARAHRAHRRHEKRNPAVVTKTIFFDPSATGIRSVGGGIVGAPVAITPSSTQRTKEAKTTSTPDQKTTAQRTTLATTTQAKSTSTQTSSSLQEGSSTTSSSSILTALGSSAGSQTPSSTASHAAVSSAASTSGGLSSGATAGLAAAGVAIFIVAAILSVLFFRRKAQQKKQEAYGNLADEKNAFNGSGPTPVAGPATRAAVGAAVGAGAPSTPVPSPIPVAAVTEFDEKLAPSPSITSERAPRISLRPVTQFMPNIDGSDAGAGAACLASAAAAQKAPKTQRSGLGRSPSRKEPPPALVLDQSHVVPVGLESAGTSALPLPPKGPSSPTPSSFTDSSVSGPFNTPMVAGLPSAATAPVHRVQMDFTPSMGDELELKGGQLVRILHEYDDGWALCIRLDRSQQGVCPRTCLSQRPVKPRPNGAHRGPPRPDFPNGAPVGQSPRPQSPAIRSQSPAPRPMSPAIRIPGAGYQRPQYKPAARLSSCAPPPTPTITVSPSVDDPHASPQPQSPVTSTPRLAIAPIRPSPLSNQTSSDEAENTAMEQTLEMPNFEQPAEPSQLIEPVQPAQPLKPVEHVQPVQPTQPVEPVQPVQQVVQLQQQIENKTEELNFELPPQLQPAEPQHQPQRQSLQLEQQQPPVQQPRPLSQPVFHAM